MVQSLATARTRAIKYLDRFKGFRASLAGKRQATLPPAALHAVKV